MSAATAPAIDIAFIHDNIIAEIGRCERIIDSQRSSEHDRYIAKLQLDNYIEATYTPQSSRFDNIIADTLLTYYLHLAEAEQSKWPSSCSCSSARLWRLAPLEHYSYSERNCANGEVLRSETTTQQTRVARGRYHKESR